jgi:hypothetical protein
VCGGVLLIGLGVLVVENWDFNRNLKFNGFLMKIKLESFL